MHPTTSAGPDRVAPRRIGPDAHLVHQVQRANDPTRSFYVNSLVITGREPVIVDTGAGADGGQWLEDVFAIVAPDDVRWIVLSHDDPDHTGNLDALIGACSKAVVVSTPDVFEHGAEDLALLPADRRRSAEAGDRIDVGDRGLLLVQPPVRDAAPTLGVLDQLTGLYWSADTFACLLDQEPVETVAELAPEHWAHGMAVFADHLLSPSLDLIDEVRFASACDRTQALGMTTVAGAHSPLITENSLDRAFSLLRSLPRTAGSVDIDRRLLDRPVRGGHATATAEVLATDQPDHDHHD